jgi:hypothetical protein
MTQFRPLSYASFEVFHNNVIEESGLLDVVVQTWNFSKWR